jgi:hypothetical protein
VTFNLKDFPQDILNQHSLSSVHPDKYLSSLYLIKKCDMDESIKRHLKNLTQTKPKKSLYIEKLKDADVGTFATLLESEDAKGNLFSEIWE